MKSFIVTRKRDRAQIRVLLTARMDTGGDVVVWRVATGMGVVTGSRYSEFWAAHERVRLYQCGHYAASRDGHALCNACRQPAVPPVPCAGGRGRHAWPAKDAPQPQVCLLCGTPRRGRQDHGTGTPAGAV